MPSSGGGDGLEESLTVDSVTAGEGIELANLLEGVDTGDAACTRGDAVDDEISPRNEQRFSAVMQSRHAG